MENNNGGPRPKLRHGRRVPIMITLAPATHEFLSQFGYGNRSAAVEKLVAIYIEREKARAEAFAEARSMIPEPKYPQVA